MKKSLKYFYKSLIIFVLLINFFELKIFERLNKTIGNNKISVCICTYGKKENRYAREFVEYYKKLEVDKIFLYDNNDLLGEKFEEVINDYIISGFVEILNWRGKTKQQINIMNDCYRKNYKIFDWLMFYEFDEYIFLKDFKNIKSFLNDKRFLNCKAVQLNWVLHTDNNNLYYENKSLLERFPEREVKSRGRKTGGLSYIKTIIRGNLTNLKIIGPHRLSTRIKGCNGFGKEHKLIGIATNESDYENYYIDHYIYKSTEEFIEKVNKGCAFKYLDKNYQLGRIGSYFRKNKITLEKIELIENRTGINLSKYKSKLKKKNSFEI